MLYGSLKWKNPHMYLCCEGDGGSGGQQGGQGDDGGAAGDSIQITVGGEKKSFTPEQIAQSLEKAGNLEKTVESLTGFQKVLTQYGVTPDEYLRNSEAAFAMANSLIEQGIIDQDGNVIKKKAEEPKPKPTPGFGFPSGGEGDKKLDTVMKALTQISNKVKDLDENQTLLYRRNIQQDVKAVHPELENEDVSALLALAQRDKSKGFWDHAKDFAQEKSAKNLQIEKSYVKSTVEALVKIGAIKEGSVDLEKLDSLDLNTLKEQDPAGAAPVYEGKKFMFGSRMRRLKSSGADLSGYSSPAKVTHEMFKKKGL
jgi:hypothetical protein